MKYTAKWIRESVEVRCKIMTMVSFIWNIQTVCMSRAMCSSRSQLKEDSQGEAVSKMKNILQNVSKIHNYENNIIA